MATTIVALGTAVLTSAVGLSPALGAFMAGVLLADSEYRHELEADIEPFRGLLMGLFFVSVGMSVALELLGDHLSHCVQDALRAGGDEAAAKVEEAQAAIERLVRS